MPFYGEYTIDTWTMGCDTVIVSECSWNHRYANICDLVSACLPPSWCSLPDCVVNFLNTLDTQQTGYYLSISPSKCLQAVPAPVSDTDYRVSVDSIDTPGYLVDKIKSCGNITITPAGPAGARYLELCAVNTWTFLWLTDIPDNIYAGCVSLESSNSFIASHIVVNQTHDGLTTYCETKPMGRLFLSGDVQIEKTGLANLAWWTRQDKQIHWFIGNLGIARYDTGCFLNYPTVSSSLKPVDWSPTVPSLRVSQSGVRRFSFKGNAKINMWVQAFRIYIASNLPKLHGCVDSKFWAGPNPKVPMVFSYNLKATNTGEPVVSHFNFGWETEMYISDSDITNSWGNVIVSLAFACDTAAWTWEDPEVTLFSAGLSWGTYNAPAGNMQNFSWLSIGIEFIRKKDYDV